MISHITARSVDHPVHQLATIASNTLEWVDAPPKSNDLLWPQVVYHKPNKPTPTYRTQKLNIDRRNPDGSTALIHAAFDGKIGYVRLLIAAGASVDLATQRGDTALIGAAYNGHSDIVLALVAAGADLNATDEDGRTALHWAVVRGHLDAVRLLLSLGVSTTICDSVDNTPLHWSIILNDREICELLLEFEEQ